MDHLVIRPYQFQDREAVRDIAYDTAFLGDPGSAFFEDKEVLQDFLTSYYLDYEPQSCFSAVIENKVIGYIIGAKDCANLNKVFADKLCLKLLLKAIRHNIIFNKKNLAFIFNLMASLLRGELKSPDFSKDYPATFHINIKEGFRNQGIGSGLIEAYLGYLAKEKVKAVHIATLSEKAANFYHKLGFSLLDKSRRSYFRYILHRKLDCFIYGKKL